jgi:hypothetical protein
MRELPLTFQNLKTESLLHYLKKITLVTRFTKEQIALLLLHLQIPNIVCPQVSGGQRIFTGEWGPYTKPYKIATGMDDLNLSPNFVSDPREYSSMLKWLIKHVFTTFYNKICRCSLEVWLDIVDDCREIIRQCISRPPSPLELEIDPTLDFGTR